ncbi:MAG: Gfo/Idh/MocA family oxidoreductase [Planctomycetaceae bacterium]|nr:Gfo/Idh/MocA family oxidoreductase [Planctomycetaceae bacterium]
MLNIAIIGTGAISPNHIEGYLAYPERCRIVALVDPYTDRAEASKKKFNLDCRVVADVNDIIGASDIDAVSICTPPSTHAPLTKAFLEAGKHVLVEKPMATSLEECDVMIDAAKRSGAVLSVVAQNRFRTPAMRLKRVLESGLLGEINHIQVNSFWWRAGCYYDLDWRGTWASEGGGCTLNHSVHHVDLMLWFVGMPYQTLSAFDNLAHDNSECEDLSISILRFKPHIMGQLTSSLLHYGEEQSITIQAANACVAMPWKILASSPMENGFPSGDNESLIREVTNLYNSLPEVAHEGHAGQIGDYMTAIETGGTPLITGQDGKNTIDVILGIYKSALEHQPVSLPLTAGDDFYTRDGLLKRTVKFHEKTKSVTGFGGSGSIIVDGKKTRADRVTEAIFSTQTEKRSMSSGKINLKTDGFNYAPESVGEVKKVVKPGEFVFAAAHLDHGHIYGMTNGLLEAGAELRYVYDPNPTAVAAFVEKYPQVKAVDSLEQIFKDGEVRMVAGAAVNSERCGIGLAVLRAGRDYFCDKPLFTTMAQLNEAKKVVAETKRRYMAYFSERLHVECAVKAGQYIQEGLIGRVVQVIGLGPHRMSIANRPPWFFDEEKVGGILCDIGSHQIDQFLYYTGASDATLTSSNVANYRFKEYPGYQDFGEMSFVADNGAVGYFRLDWLTPNALETWGDGRTMILGTHGYIELRKYTDIGVAKQPDTLYIVTDTLNERQSCTARSGSRSSASSSSTASTAPKTP